MNKTILTAVVAMGLLRFTDIDEDIICSVESGKIRDEIETAKMRFEQGKIDQSEFENIISYNDKKLEDLLIS